MTEHDPSLFPELAEDVESALSQVMLPRRGDMIAATAVFGMVAEQEFEMAEHICKSHKEPARLALAMAFLVVHEAIQARGECSCGECDDAEPID